MTDRMAALAALSLADVPERAAALDDFYARYAGDPLIVDKWFSLQAAIPEPATLDRVKALTAHPAFSFANPNRVRALIGAFAMANQKQFNRADGAGYDFVADTVLALDPEESAARGAAALRAQELARARAAAARARRSGPAARGGRAVVVGRRGGYRQARAGRGLTRSRAALTLRSIHASPLTCMDASRRVGAARLGRPHASRRITALSNLSKLWCPSTLRRSSA